MSDEKQISIFNIGDNADAINNAMYTQKGESPLFDLRVKNVGDSLSFVIRPLPFAANVLNSKVMKFYYAIPDMSNVAIFDSATTFNDPANNKYEFCPISDIWLRLTNSTDPNVKKMAERVRRQTAIYCYVQIIACPSEPALNGKIMPMHIPIELEKAMKLMAFPTEDQIALGRTPVQPFDLFRGSNFTCTITGHKPFGDTLMRQWKIEKDPASEVSLPLGPNGAMVPISKLAQNDVLAYFIENQPHNLQELYGYKAPNVDTQIKAMNWLLSICGFLPGMRDQIIANFPALQEVAKTDVAPETVNVTDPMGQPAVEQAPVETQAAAAPVETQAAAAPVEQAQAPGQDVVIPE